jgi:L-threonylcarbamoyladenylate synthase
VRVVALDVDRPLLLTSANIAGQGEARTLEQVAPELRAGADLVLDAGELPGTPSTIVDLGELERGGGWRIVRQGACTRRQVQLALVGS